MPAICSVLTCSNYFNSLISSHRFPKDEYLKARWSTLTGLLNSGKNVRICSHHFPQESFKLNNGKKTLCDYAEPTIDVPGVSKYLVKIDELKNKSYFIKLADGSSIQLYGHHVNCKKAIIMLPEILIHTNESEEKSALMKEIDNLKSKLKDLIKINEEKKKKQIKEMDSQLSKLKAKLIIERSKNKLREKDLKEKIKAQRPTKEKFKREFAQAVGHVFAPAQQSMILNKSSRSTYSTREISQSLVLRQYAGAKGHDYVRKCMKIPIPSITTIKRSGQLNSVRMSLFSVSDTKDFARLLIIPGVVDHDSDPDLEEIHSKPEKPSSDSGEYKPSSKDHVKQDLTSKKTKTTDIWTESEVEELSGSSDPDFIDFSSDPRSRPVYKMTLSQVISPEDIFLQMGEKSPMSIDSIKLEVSLPGEDFPKIKLDVKKTSVCLTSPKYCLYLYLPHNVDPNAGSAKWFAEKSTLDVNLKISV